MWLNFIEVHNMKLTIFATLLSVACAFPFEAKDRVLKVGPHEYKLASESDKLQLRAEHVRFIDVSSKISYKQAVERGLVGEKNVGFFQQIMSFNGKQIEEILEVPEYVYPKNVSHHDTVLKLFDQIDITGVYSNLANFTSFYNRYYKSKSGFESAKWLYGTIEEIISPIKDRATIKKIDHKIWDQFSIVVTIPGKIDDIVVVGAHQDSANLILPSITRAPGADDDGSGTVTILEALRILVNNDFKPHNTVEFHFYSAEEGGLLGSYDVFDGYRNASKTVLGMLQQDMTGSTTKSIENGVEVHFGLISDYTSVKLNNFIKLIIDTYNDIPYHETECGYACSDHASAIEFGYPSSFLIESEMNLTLKYIHTLWDTIDRIDFEHVKEHIKLTLGFAYELGLAKVHLSKV